MDGHKGEQAGISSSVALLQERFRQLEQVRERREEKEFRKQILGSKRSAPSQHSDPGKSSFQHQIHTERARTDDSISNRRNSNRYHAGLQNAEGQTSRNFWSSESTTGDASDEVEYSDVDTSLRL